MSKNIYQYSTRRTISELYAGLGTLLIDGDALIDYLNSEVTNEAVASFINDLKKCDFDKVDICIFTDYFSKSEVYSSDDLKALFLDPSLLLTQ